MGMKEIIKETEDKMRKTIESAKREFSEVRTGRAHTGLVEGLHVKYYDTPTLVKELAAISVPDPRMIVIQPWDATVIPDLEKAINDSNIGGSVSNDGKIVRISVPPLSEERRSEMTKVVKEMAEHARISLRTIRRDANERIKKLQGDKTISEDDSFKAQDGIQKLTDRFIKDIDSLLEEKNKHLMER